MNQKDDDEPLVLEKKKIKIEDIMTPPEKFKKRICKPYFDLCSFFPICS